MKGWVALPGLLVLGGTQIGGCDWTVKSTAVVVNDPDAFSAALSGVHYTGQVDEKWACGAPQARLRIGPSITSGKVDILVYDGLEALVYANSHSGVGDIDVQTDHGAPGDWRVVLDYLDATIDGPIVLEAEVPETPDVVWLGAVFGSNDRYAFHPAWKGGQIHVSVGPAVSGSVRVRVWHGQKSETDAPTFERTVGPEGLNVLTPSGAAGTWTIKLDFTDAVLDGSVWVAAHP